MCGIGGIYRLHDLNKKHVHDINFIANSIASRGPNNLGIWKSQNDSVLLCHTRLSIIEISSASNQPMLSQDCKKIIVFNGEIYNYKELREKCIRNGVVFKTLSDTEVLLNIYEEYGVIGLSMLRGMYAFAIYDLDKDELFLARDHYGIKPLYYYYDGLEFAFSSYARSLGNKNSVTEISRGILQSLLFGASCEPDTYKPDVFCLEAGTYKLISKNGILNGNIPLNSNNQSRCQKKNDRILKIGRSIEESVKYHLVSDVPVGIMLSAGIDSSILAAATSKFINKNKKIYALTIVFNKYLGSAYDEISLAAKVSKIYGLEHIYEIITEKDLHDSFPQILKDMDQPTADGINTWFVARLARRNNIQVLLSGVGGDELLGGYKTYLVVPLLLKIRNLFNINLNLFKSILNFLIRITDIYNLRRYERIFLRLQLILFLKPSILNAYIVKRLVFTPFEIARILKIPEKEIFTLLKIYLSRLNYSSKLNFSNKNKSRQDMDFDLFFLETIHYLRNQLLRDADWAGMAHSVEIRTPFCDNFLRADVCAQFLCDKSRKKLKYILSRDYFKLPKEIYNRKKTGFITQIPYKLIDKMIELLPQKKNRYWNDVTEYQKLTLSICLKRINF